MIRGLPSRAICLAFVAGIGLAGCTQFPELDARTTRAAANAPYPTLVPLDGLLARAAAPGRAEAATVGLEARAAALNARAAALGRRQVIDAAERARLQAAQARLQALQQG